MAEKKRGALEHTRRLLEAQHQQTTEQERVWRGLAVVAGELQIVVPIANVAELAVCENITPVPLTHGWIRGLTNLRGQLITVVDLSVFVGSSETRLSRDARIIVLSDNGLNTCLLVNNVAGLKVFPEDSPAAPVSGVPNELRKYFSGRVTADGQDWLAMDIPTLANDSRYRSPSRVSAAVA
jgi:twitching motility protein PilI